MEVEVGYLTLPRECDFRGTSDLLKASTRV